MAKKKDESTTIISGSRKTVKKKAPNGRQYPGVGGRKTKRLNAILYKSLFKPQRMSTESAKKAVSDKQVMDTDQVECVGGNMKKQVGGECSASNRNDDYDACADNDSLIFKTSSSSRHDIENQQEHDPCDKVTGTCSKFVEFWVPVHLSNVQLEQYCATLISNATVLCCGSNSTVGEALHDILVSNRKCCNHPYVVDPTLHSIIKKDQEPTMLQLDADIKASGKLQFLDLVLPELKKRSLRVLILFQSSTVTTKGVPCVREMLFDFVQQRFGEDSYECVLTGLQPSKRQTALNKFNKDMAIPFFLLEHRACNSSIKLTSVDIIFIFDSDLTPANDLKSIQKISVDSHSKQIKIFRLYSSSTLEEKILKLADTNESRLQNVRSRYDVLLKWGAFDLFDRLTEFHCGSVFGISPEESFLKDAVEEFIGIIFNESEKIDKSKAIITRVQNFGIYSKNETKSQLPDGEQSHIFWKKLLEGRFPIWKFVPFSTPRQRKRPHYLDGATKGTGTEDGGGGGVKIRRKTVKPVIETVTGNLNEGCFGVPTHNGPQSSSSDRFQSTAVDSPVDNDKSLHDLLKATMSELFSVLELTDVVKITVEKFLEFVLENYHFSSDHTSKLQALMISMCWVGSALENINIDKLDSFDIAKKQLKFICDLKEAYSVFAKLQAAKEAFVQMEKLDTEKSQINKFIRECEEQRVRLENNYKLDQASIQSMHRKLSVRSEKLSKLKESFVSKMEKHRKIREVYLTSQLTTHSLHGPEDNSPEVGPSHDEPVDRINVAEGDGRAFEKQMTDDAIGQVSTQHHHDDIIEHDVAKEVDYVAVKHQNEAGEDLFSSNPPCTDSSSPEVIIRETENECLQVEPSPHGENQDKEPPPNSTGEIDDVEHRPSLDASQLGQTIPEALSLNPHDKPSLITENQSDMLQQSEILLEPTTICEQLPDESTSPVTAEIQNPNNTLSLALNMFDNNVNHVSHPTPNHADPLEAEEDRLRLAIDDVVKLQQETKERLNIDCEKEIEKMCAEINQKYEAKCQEQEAAFELKKKEIDKNVKLAMIHKILAADIRSNSPLNMLSGSTIVRRFGTSTSTSSVQSSVTHPTTSPPPPTALGSQPPLQIVHQPADLFSTQPPPPPPPITTNRPSIPSTTSTTSRLTSVIIPITPSTTPNTTTLSPSNHQRVNCETLLSQASRIRLPVTDSHIRPFRPTTSSSSVPLDYATPPYVTNSNTPLTSPSNLQSLNLPSLPTSSRHQSLPPLPPEPKVVSLPPLQPSSDSSPPSLSPLPPEPNIMPPPPPSSKLFPPLPTQPCAVPPPPPGFPPPSDSSPQPLPPLPLEPYIVPSPPPLPSEPYIEPPPPPPPSASSPQPLPPLPSEPYVEPPPPPPRLLPPLPIEPYIVPPPPPPITIPATSSTLPHTSSDTRGRPSLTLTDHHLNLLLKSNHTAALMPIILPATSGLRTHPSGPEFICLLDDD